MLPPYSPDFNPIEETFHALKSFIRKHQEMAKIFDDNYQGFLWWALGQFMEGKTVRARCPNAVSLVIKVLLSLDLQEVSSLNPPHLLSQKQRIIISGMRLSLVI
jgi:hypothetical protein